MNETDVRETLVRPLLERLGYRHGTDANIIHGNTFATKSLLGTQDPKRSATVGRADYILRSKSPLDALVVEVQACPRAISQDAVEQAHMYADHPEIANVFSSSHERPLFPVYEPRSCWNLLLVWEYEDEDR